MRASSSSSSSFFFSSSSSSERCAKPRQVVENVPAPGTRPEPRPYNSGGGSSRPTGYSGQSHFEHKHHCHRPAPSRPTPPAPSTPSTPSTPLPSTPSKPGTPPNIPPVLQDALGRMDTVLNETTNRSRDNGAVVTANAVDVEARDNTRPGSKRYEAASQMLKSNASLEQQRLGQLPAAERERYLGLKNSMLSQGTNNPVAALSLQKMLFSGRLEKGPDLAGQGSVLEHLTAIDQGQGLHRQVNKKTLLTDLVQELATPSVINQGGRGTCAPTALSIGLNITRPAEYARLMRGMASPEGQVRMASGQTLRREPDTSFGDDGSHRALTQRLLAPAFMEIANLDKDYRDSASKENRNAGAGGRGMELLGELVYGHQMTSERASNDARTLERIKAELAQGQNVLVGMHYGASRTSGHELLVTGLESRGGQEYVKYINPWGQEERMTRSNFMNRLTGMTYDPGLHA